MLLAAGVMFHFVLTIDRGVKPQLALFVVLSSVLILASLAHIKLGDSTLHQIVFGIMVVVVGFRTVKLTRLLIHDEAMNYRLRRLARMGTCKPTIITITVSVITIIFLFFSFRAKSGLRRETLQLLFSEHMHYGSLTSLHVLTCEEPGTLLDFRGHGYWSYMDGTNLFFPFFSFLFRFLVSGN